MINHTAWLHDRIVSSQPKKLRMPLLCALSKSVAAPILSEGWNEITRGLNTHYYQLNKNETYITSIASTDNTIIAMGSGNPSGDIYFINENTIAKENEITSSRFHEIYHTQLQRPIFSLDWSQQHLLVGSNDGIIQLYDTKHLDQSENQLENIGEYQSQHIPTSFSALPGKCALNSHIKTVSFHPTYSNSASNGNDNSLDRSTHFLTTAARHVELWDVNYTGNTHLLALEPDDSPINVAHWSSLSPSLIVTGGEAGHLYVADLRVKENQGIIWKAPNAHSGVAIRDSQFNPFIPYWLASGGDDCIVNIWDLRATCHKPLAKIDGHHAPITSITWTNIRPEKLATTSRDGTFRIWSLSGSTIPIWDSYCQLADHDCHRKSQLPQLEENWWPGTIDSKVHSMDENFGDMLPPDDDKVVPFGAFGIGAWGKSQVGPLYYGDMHKYSKGSIVQVLVSKTRPGLFYCATSSGQLCSQISRPTTRGALDYPHRYDFEKDPLCYTIDNAIHYRHINVAKNLIENLKDMPMDDDEQKRIRDDRVKDFEDCLTLQPPIQENDWNIDSIPASESKRLWTDTDMWQCALDTFGKDLIYRRTHLAPGCETIFGDIPLDTGDLHPRLSNQLMKGVDFTLNNSNPTFPWDQTILPSSPTFYDSSARKSEPELEIVPKSQTNKNLRRSSTTPNLTSEDLLETYTDLKHLNERNSSGTVLNTGANWTPLQRAKTSITQKQPKQISRQPSLSTSSLKSIFTKSTKRLESPLRQQTKSPIRQGSPLGQQEESMYTTGPQHRSVDSPRRQNTPVSLHDEPSSGQSTPHSQQGISIIRQESSPSSASQLPTTTTTTVMQEEQQPKKKTNPFARQNTSRGKKKKFPTQRKNNQTPPSLPPPQQQQNVSPTQLPQQDEPAIQHDEPRQKPKKLHIGTTNNDNNQSMDTTTTTSPGTDTFVSSPQQMDIKSIIKYGSFGQPGVGNKSAIGTSASTSNLSTVANNNPFTRNMSSDALLANTTTASNTILPVKLSDEPMEYSSTFDSGGGGDTTSSANKVDDDTDQPHTSRQHTTLLAPANSLRRAFTKKLRRKKTVSSSSSMSSYNAADRDPQHHRQQQPQPDISRPSSRNAI